jgi:hypothetical protein
VPISRRRRDFRAERRRTPKRRFGRFAAAAVLTGAALLPLSGRADDINYMLPKPARRLAFVVANANYSNAAKLPGTVEDAKLINETLAKLGFSVTVAPDVHTRADFINAYLFPFLSQIDEGSFVVFYFSGHGFTYQGESYLTPLDFPPVVKSKAVFSTFISLTSVRDMIEARRPGALIVLLDACRDFSETIDNSDAAGNAAEHSRHSGSDQPGPLDCTFTKRRRSVYCV